jgi:quercetin dioxygenase-like cupin family protein
MNRRDLLAAALGSLLASSRGAAVPDQGAAHDTGRGGRGLAASDGELVYVGRDPVRIKISPSGAPARFAMITQEVSPGTSIPIHAHDREDEIIFIQSGRGEGTVGEQIVQLAAGSTLYVPQGTWHGGRNTGPDVMMWIAIYSPSGFEGYFREIGRRAPDDPPRRRTPEQRDALDKRYAIRYRG